MTSLIEDTADKVFAQIASTPTHGAWDAELWSMVAENSFPLALLDDAAGGFGFEPAETLSILRVAARHSLCLPVAETMLANWICADAGLPVTPGPATVALVPALPDHPSGPLVARRVGWAGSAQTVVAVGPDGQIAVLEAPPVLARGFNLAGEPRDDLDLGAAFAAPAASGRSVNTYRALGATLSVVAIAGAADAALSLSVEYVNDRVQFGKPIGRNQAIQHQLAVIAGEVAASLAAAEMVAAAFPLLQTDERRFCDVVAAAKIRTGEAAGICAAIAHQVHGAIGFTQEYRLHRLTKRLWSWRDEFGTETFWADHLGGQLFAAQSPDPWQFLTR